MSRPQVARATVHAEMDEARATFHRLLAGATAEELRAPTAGTRWTNEQMLFHMLFGYLIVLRLRLVVKTFGRLPDVASRVFAGLLNLAWRPFHAVNYWGSRGGPVIFPAARMGRRLDHILDALHRHLDADSEEALGLSMHFPRRWDPYFADRMSLAEVYHYATLHFDHHRAQLTLGHGDPRDTRSG